ncbi:unnamed protein product [Ascophyllum nodosum]
MDEKQRHPDVNTPSTDIVRRNKWISSLTESSRPGQFPHEDRGHDAKEDFQGVHHENSRGARGERQRGDECSLAIIRARRRSQHFPELSRRRETTWQDDGHRRSGSLGSPAIATTTNYRPWLKGRRNASAPPTAAPTVPSSSSPAFFGNGDDSRYWDYAFRSTHRGDLGHSCRECKRPFLNLNETIAVRRGGRIELKYHQACFSMVADPRSQPTSSANVGKFVDALKDTAAPEELYRKMRTRGHW